MNETGLIQWWPLLAYGAAQVVLLAGAYYGLKADNAKLASDVALGMLTERTSRESSQLTLKGDLMMLINAVDSAVKEIDRRVGTLERGKDEWTQELRNRSHELANQMQTLVSKVDRLDKEGVRRS